MKYQKLFKNKNEYYTFAESEQYIEPNVSIILENTNADVKYSKPHFLTFKSKEENSTISFNRVGESTSVKNAALQYSTDGGQNWDDYTLGTTITLENVDDTVKFKGTNDSLSDGSSNYHKFVMTGKLTANGDVTSLFNETGDDYPLSNYSCCNLFSGCSSLQKAPSLPSTNLGTKCYYQMFKGCTSLTDSPELPSLSIPASGYAYMFEKCTSLTGAPELPAMQLSNHCYRGMFQNCSNLQTAPQLNATGMSNSCYAYMFCNCSNLVNVQESLPAMEMKTRCYESMFHTCYHLLKAPELPATTLADYCYAYMFQNNYGLLSAQTILPATTLKPYCYTEMFYDCPMMEKAPVLPALTLVNGCYTYLFTYCSKLNYIKAMFLTTPTASYTRDWWGGVCSAGTFVKNSQATWNVTANYYGTPNGWTIETASE